MREKKHILLIYLMLFSLFVGFFSFLSDNVSADIVSTSFEDSTIGQQYSNSWLSTHNKSTDIFYVSNDHNKEGSKCFKILHSLGWWNYTYDASLEMINWSSWLYCEDFALFPSCTNYINFTDNDGNNLLRIKMWGSSSSTVVVEYCDFEGSWHDFGSGPEQSALAEDHWCAFNLTYLANDSVNYAVYNGYNDVWYSTIDTPATIVDNPRIVSVYFDLPCTHSYIFCFDLHNIAVSEFDAFRYGGDITINVYNESDPSSAISNWDILVYNSIGSVMYSATSQNNPLVINASDLDEGLMYIQVNAANYSVRTYYLDYEYGINYTLDAYLPYAGHLYYIQVINNYGSNIDNAGVTISKLIGSSFKEISSGVTNVLGLFPVYLIGGGIYRINISASGYDSVVFEEFYANPDEYGLDYPIVFILGETYVEIPDVYMDQMTLSAYNNTTMKIQYINLNDDNNYVNFTIYDFIGDTLLRSYNVTTTPDNISIYFNFSGYDLDGDILKVVANAYRLNGSVYTLTKYFNIIQATRRGTVSSFSSAIAAIFSIGICLFGFTIAHPKKVLGVVGIIVIIIAIAVTAFAEQTWYIHLVQSVELILLIFILLVFKEEGTHAI